MSMILLSSCEQFIKNANTLPENFAMGLNKSIDNVSIG